MLYLWNHDRSFFSLYSLERTPNSVNRKRVGRNIGFTSWPLGLTKKIAIRIRAPPIPWL